MFRKILQQFEKLDEVHLLCVPFEIKLRVFFSILDVENKDRLKIVQFRSLEMKVSP